MKRATSLFNEKDRQSVEAAVAAAEKNTSGEIVCVVASTSGRYDRAEDLLGLTLGIAAVIGWWCLRQCLATDGWEAPALGLLQLIAMLLILLAGFAAGAALAGRVPLLAAPFIRRAEQQEEVERRALEVLQRQRLRNTQAATGVLIYVSLFERMVRVIGDDGINARLKPDDWTAICERVLQGMRDRKAAAGLVQAIALSGELLSRHFPVSAGDRNELSNGLILID